MRGLKFGLCAALIVPGFAVVAQKLPTVQTLGLRAPAAIKIDGKTTEWADKFQAYNKNIEAFYTISNDDENLYLTIKADKNEIAGKIIRGGLSLIINHAVKKNDPEAVALTYPILRGGDMAAVTNLFAGKSFKQDEGVETSLKQLNDMFEAKSKTIEIAGIKTITDKAISVYNDEGINAMGAFEAKNAFVYELAVPLKYLNLPAVGAFSYHIKVNEEPTTLSVQTGGPPPPPIPGSSLATTDFWGIYTLAGK